MARVYSMPPDTNEKEKIFGGILTLSQAGWIGGGFFLALILALLLFQVFKFFVIVICAVPLVAGCVFALKKKGNYTYFRYLTLKRRYDNRIKHYINSGMHDSLEFSAGGEDE